MNGDNPWIYLCAFLLFIEDEMALICGWFNTSFKGSESELDFLSQLMSVLTKVIDSLIDFEGALEDFKIILTPCILIAA